MMNTLRENYYGSKNIWLRRSLICTRNKRDLNVNCIIFIGIFCVYYLNAIIIDVIPKDGGRKMIRTESGGRVPASYRSGRYDEWKKRNATDVGSDDEQQDRNANRKKPGKSSRQVVETKRT